VTTEAAGAVAGATGSGNGNGNDNGNDGIGDGGVPRGGAGSPRRAELGEFLKARRARLRPEDVGLPPAPRRRTPGLRREEVALLAGVGVTWYTWLEQGRPINASTQVLDAVARTLRLDRFAREHMYRLAEATPLRSWREAAVVPDSAREVLHGLDPLPAALINTRFDVIEANEAHRDLFRGWHLLPCLHKNLVWCCVTEPNAPERFLNYAEEVPYLVARLRAEYGRHVGDPEWEEDIRRLTDLSPQFAELWARHEVAEPAMRVQRFVHPDAGALTFIRTELDIIAVADMRITVYTPGDDETRAQLPVIQRRRQAAAANQSS
jgi:transcriptional regulator with XRE-family HTH domain